MVTARCPNRQTLLQYSLGALADEQSDDLASHLDSCPDCQATIVTLEDADDTLVGRLRMPPSSDSFAAEPEFQAALAHAIAMPAAGPGAAGVSPVLPDDQADPPSLIPHVLGEYQILEELGRGGMGRVYKALHTKLDRVVAVKVLPRGRVADPQAIARFEREVKAVGRLVHPNLVHAYDAREIDGTPVLVMEFVDGLDLAELVRRTGPLPIADACELIRQTALGLQQAHVYGLVHRDIKPSNIMLSRTGEVKLLDLGLALLKAHEPVGWGASPSIGGQHDEAGAAPQPTAGSLAEKVPDTLSQAPTTSLVKNVPDPSTAQDLTAAHQIMGTVSYMAPEQAGDAHQVDIRADIYGLGCTLYKLLSGRAPFPGAEYRTLLDQMLAHRTKPVEPIRQLRPEVPERLAAVLDRMLAKDPADRFATPAEVAEAIEPFTANSDLASLLTGSPRHPLTASPPRPPRRLRRLLLAAGGAAAILALAFVIIEVYKDGRKTTVRAPEGSEITVRPSGDVEVKLARPEKGDVYAPASVFVPAGSGGLNRAIGLAFSPDNKYLLVSSFNTDQVMRYDAVTGAPRGISGQPDDAVFVTRGLGGLVKPEYLRFGPDGNLYVVSSGTHQVFRYNGKTGALVDVFVKAANNGGLFRPCALTFDAKGYLYVSGGDSNNVVQFDKRGNPKVFVPARSGGLEVPHALVFAPAAQAGSKQDVYAVSHYSNEVLRFDGATGAFLGAFVPAGTGGLMGPLGITLGPDGSLFVTNNGNGLVVRFDGRTGKFINAVARVATPTDLAWGPDGALYVSTKNESSVMRISIGFNRAEYHQKRAWDYAVGGDYDKAVAEYTQAIDLALDTPDWWNQRAMAELSYGQLDAYRRHCAELLRYFGQRKTVGHRDSFQISETCFLAPDAVADFSTALAIANNTVNALPDDPAYLFARGAVLYRAGRIEEAIADLDRSHILLKEPTFHTPFMMLRRAQVCSFLAMAHHRLGHGEEAKRWFDKMVEQADAAMEEHRSGKVSFYWNIRAPMKLLRPEAAQLLGISEKPAGQDVSVNKSPSASLIRPRE